MVTSYRRGDRKPPRQATEVTLTRFLRGAEVRAFRKAHGLSAAGLARRLVKNAQTGATYSRPYVKRVESGGMRASSRFVQAFDELRAMLTGSPPIEPRPLSVVMYHKLPEDVQEIEVLAKPMQCKGCRKWFVPITPNQRMHNTDACKRTARRRTKTKRKEAKK